MYLVDNYQLAMSTYANKIQKNKSQVLVEKPIQQKETAEPKFVDNRPESKALKTLQASINNITEVKQLKSFKAGPVNYNTNLVTESNGKIAAGEPNQGKLTPVLRENNTTGLPDHLKVGIEHLSGIAMDDVKVIYNSPKPAQLQAYAYAQGTDIHIASGQEKHLPHEAWHVVQQKQGRVKPTMQMKSGVDVNDNVGLETEADLMGVKAQQHHGDVVQLRSVSLLNSAVIQRKAVDAQINGVTHLVLTKEGSIFDGREYLQLTHSTALVIDNEQKIRSRRGPNQEEHTEEDRRGLQNYIWIKVLSVDGKPVSDNVYVREDTIIVSDTRGIVATSNASNGIRNRPAGDVSQSGQITRGLSFSDEERWNELGKYITLTVAAAETQQISKNPDFDSSAYPEAAQEYIKQFQIISKKTFDNKINEIAIGMMSLGVYTCIVSEVGKSNFWLTGKVLDQVRRLGGTPPLKVISVPVKEKGDLDGRTGGQYAKILEKAGHIVFLDDGSYSGSQLVKFINNMIGSVQIPHSIGLVASTRQAKERLGTHARFLASPHHIDTFGMGMDIAYRSLKLPLHHDNVEMRRQPGDGNALAALHYKVPDYASVRNKLLVGTKDKPGPIVGYNEGRGTPVNVHGKTIIGFENGTEPYKSVRFLNAINDEESLAKMGIEDPPAAAMSGFGLMGQGVNRRVPNGK